MGRVSGASRLLSEARALRPHEEVSRGDQMPEWGLTCHVSSLSSRCCLFVWSGCGLFESGRPGTTKRMPSLRAQAATTVGVGKWLTHGSQVGHMSATMYRAGRVSGFAQWCV